jgi:hypothetical protein
MAAGPRPVKANRRRLPYQRVDLPASVALQHSKANLGPALGPRMPRYRSHARDRAHLARLVIPSSSAQADSDGMGGLPPQPPDNLDQTAAFILKPEVPPGGNEELKPRFGDRVNGSYCKRRAQAVNEERAILFWEG